ncbi:MAG: hypothetical protein AAB133_09410, partial [Pseudomonadota bacterium]
MDIVASSLFKLAELLKAENVILAESCSLEQRIATGSGTRCSGNARNAAARSIAATPDFATAVRPAACRGAPASGHASDAKVAGSGETALAMRNTNWFNQPAGSPRRPNRRREVRCRSVRSARHKFATAGPRNSRPALGEMTWL